MIVRLGDLAGAVDPNAAALPEVMDLVVEVRSTAPRAVIPTADAIRDRLARPVWRSGIPPTAPPGTSVDCPPATLAAGRATIL